MLVAGGEATGFSTRLLFFRTEIIRERDSLSLSLLLSISEIIRYLI